MQFHYSVLAFLTFATIANHVTAKNQGGKINRHLIDTLKEDRTFSNNEYCSTIRIQKLFYRIETLYFLQLAVCRIHRKPVKTQSIKLVFRKEAVAIVFQDLNIQEKDVMRINGDYLPTWHFTDLEAQKNKIRNHFILLNIAQRVMIVQQQVLYNKGRQKFTK